MATEGSLRRDASTASMSSAAPSIRIRLARSALCGARAMTASSTARCSGSDPAGPCGREVEISKLVRNSAPSALLICTSMRLWQARSSPW